MQVENKDVHQPWRLETLVECLLRNFFDDHPNEVLKVIACYVVSTAKVGNNHISSRSQ